MVGHAFLFLGGVGVGVGGAVTTAEIYFTIIMLNVLQVAT